METPSTVVVVVVESRGGGGSSGGETSRALEPATLVGARADAGEPRRANRAECRANCREKRIGASGRSECWPRMYEFYGGSWVGIMRMFVGRGRGDFVIHCFLDDWRLRR